MGNSPGTLALSIDGMWFCSEGVPRACTPGVAQILQWCGELGRFFSLHDIIEYECARITLHDRDL